MAQYIVNPGGAVHQVSDEDLPLHLARPHGPLDKQVYPRMATDEEINTWWNAQGLTRDGKPLAKTAKEAADKAATSEQAAADAKAAADKAAADANAK